MKGLQANALAGGLEVNADAPMIELANPMQVKDDLQTNLWIAIILMLVYVPLPLCCACLIISSKESGKVTRGLTDWIPSGVKNVAPDGVTRALELGGDSEEEETEEEGSDGEPPLSPTGRILSRGS